MCVCVWRSSTLYYICTYTHIRISWFVLMYGMCRGVCSEEEVSINVFAGNLSTILQKPVPTVGSQSIIPGQNKNTDLD